MMSRRSRRSPEKGGGKRLFTTESPSGPRESVVIRVWGEKEQGGGEKRRVVRLSRISLILARGCTEEKKGTKKQEEKMSESESYGTCVHHPCMQGKDKKKKGSQMNHLHRRGKKGRGERSLSGWRRQENKKSRGRKTTTTHSKSLIPTKKKKGREK